MIGYGHYILADNKTTKAFVGDKIQMLVSGTGNFGIVTGVIFDIDLTNGLIKLTDGTIQPLVRIKDFKILRRGK